MFGARLFMVLQSSPAVKRSTCQGGPQQLMLRPLVYNETPWSWRSLRPICRGGHRWLLQIQALPRTQFSVTDKKSTASARKLGTLSPQALRVQEQVSLQHAREDKANNAAEHNGRLKEPSSLRHRLFAALRSNDPERLLALSIAAFRNEELIKSLHPTTIAQIFDSLRFNELLAEHKGHAQILAPGAIRAAQGVGWKIDNISAVIGRIHDQFSTLFYEWVENGHPIDLPKCKSLLRFLSSAGEAKGARRLRLLCENHGILWDTEAYNLFLEALCWEDAYQPHQFGNLRVTDEALIYRKRLESIGSSQGYTTAIKSEAIDAFEEMMSKGYTADVQTFALLMLSMGRIGDLEGVAATLNRIWGVDVSSLADGDASSVYFENDMQPDAPLYPNEHLLFVVAHIYGSNNSLSTALKVVDFIAQKYSLRISSRTWEELARWAIVLGRRHGGTVTASAEKASLQRSLAVGKVPQATFRSLWRTMTSRRFQIVPTLPMFNWLFTTHFRRGELLDMLALLRYAQRYLGLGQSQANLEVGGLSASVTSLKDLTELEQLKALANSAVFLRWIRLMLHTNFFESRNQSLSLRWYHTCFIPNFISEWGNVWFSNTFHALHFRGMWHNRLSFHRQMQEENRSHMEVWSTSQRNRYIVRAKLPCFSVPFQEVTHSERRQHRMEREIASGENLHYDAPTQWYERSDVGDWIWLASGKGVRLKGGQFEGSDFKESQYGRRLVLPRHAFDHLDQHAAIEVRQRLASQ